MTKAVYEIDGLDFATLEEFYDVVSRLLIPGAEWGHNLDAFKEIKGDRHLYYRVNYSHL